MRADAGAGRLDRLWAVVLVARGLMIGLVTYLYWRRSTAWQQPLGSRTAAVDA